MITLRLYLFLLISALVISLQLSGCTSPKQSDNSLSNSPAQIEQAEKQTLVEVDQVKVIKVVDGDTIDVSFKGRTERVRLIGIDTPETVKPNTPVEPYGKEASNFTKTKLTGKTVFIEIDVGERDKYGRLLAYIWIDEPLNTSDEEIRAKLFNAQLLIDGYAQLLTIPPNVKYVDQFTIYQKEAREASRGLWGLQTTNSQKQNSPKSNDRNKDSGPNGEKIKGNINSKGEKIYHVPGGQFYEQTNPEEWFFSEEEAQSAGFRPSKR